jgi:hypothetical protein
VWGVEESVGVLEAVSATCCFNARGHLLACLIRRFACIANAASTGFGAAAFLCPVQQLSVLWLDFVQLGLDLLLCVTPRLLRWRLKQVCPLLPAFASD